MLVRLSLFICQLVISLRRNAALPHTHTRSLRDFHINRLRALKVLIFKQTHSLREDAIALSRGAYSAGVRLTGKKLLARDLVPGQKDGKLEVRVEPKNGSMEWSFSASVAWLAWFHCIHNIYIYLYIAGNSTT